jgi:hypothetical protein
MTILKNASWVALQRRSGRRRFHTLTAALIGAATIPVLGILGCGITDPGSGDSDRLVFRSEGPAPCELKYNFSGGVATGTSTIDFTPRIGEWNDVPVDGPGEVLITLVSGPADPKAWCNYSMSIEGPDRDDDARYVLLADPHPNTGERHRLNAVVGAGLNAADFPTDHFEVVPR